MSQFPVFGSLVSLPRAIGETSHAAATARAARVIRAGARRPDIAARLYRRKTYRHWIPAHETDRRNFRFAAAGISLQCKVRSDSAGRAVGENGS